MIYNATDPGSGMLPPPTAYGRFSIINWLAFKSVDSELKQIALHNVGGFIQSAEGLNRKTDLPK